MPVKISFYPHKPYAHTSIGGVVALVRESLPLIKRSRVYWNLYPDFSKARQQLEKGPLGSDLSYSLSIDDTSPAVMLERQAKEVGALVIKDSFGKEFSTLMDGILHATSPAKWQALVDIEKIFLLKDPKLNSQARLSWLERVKKTIPMEYLK